MEQFSEGKKRPMFDKYFSFIEALRPSDRLLFVLVGLFFVAASFYTLNELNAQYKTTVATGGGIFSEGIIGTPRFINPVLAITRADLDMVALVYSGLMKLSPEGEIVPNLAESLTIADDGLVYNVILREDIYFHDGARLQAEDVAYTIGLIQDPSLKSPLRGNWSDVVVEVINDRELNFVLKEPYTPFVENLTVGILPKHIWGDLSIEQLPFSQHNTEPIGTGPYQLETVDYNDSGLIDSYTLEAFPAGEQTAKIFLVELQFYPNEQSLITAFDAGKFIATAAFSQETLKHIDTSKYQIVEKTLPRVFSIFLNQNKSSVVRDQAVREALSLVIDREELINNTLGGYGTATESPLPPGFIELTSTSSATESASSSVDKKRQAEALLLDAGWEQLETGGWQKDMDKVPTKLSVTISTENSEIFVTTANYIKKAWEDLGVEVSLALFERSDLVQVIIRPRDYEMLLFGTDVGRSLDLFPFWHSSQKDDPGLNVAIYTNISTDKLLQTARTTQDKAVFVENVAAFEAEITKETPAIFLYSPAFTYVVRNDVNISPIERIVRPSERFSDIVSWHMKESNVWPFFAN